ncbi:MAG: hypothetical protein ABSG86_29725 [Thermoguttaceae bacterium]
MSTAAQAQPNAASPAASDGQFLEALFQPGDRILFRPIESWTENGQKKSKVDYEGTQYQLVGARGQAEQWQLVPGQLATTIKRHNERSQQTRCNVFFGVCPRWGTGGKYDQAWQIRTVRALWSDVDDGTPAEAIERCKATGLPDPSIVVSSGHGAHLYWLLLEPVVIDDGDQRPVFTEFMDQGEGKKKKPRKFIKNENGAKVYIDGKDKHNAPPLSPKAQHVQDILAGIAAKIGGDHTTDLSRLLRAPETLNRKDQRNGQEPVPCRLVEFHPERRYTIADFAKYAEASPDRARREKIGKVKLPAHRRLVPFDRVFRPDEQDKHLGAKLRKELPGILAWCVRGCLDWQRHGLGNPAEVSAATSDYQIEQDQIGRFLEECCTIGSEFKARASALLNKYLQWSGDKNMTQTAFGPELQNRGFQRVVSNGVWYRGVGILEGSEGLEGEIR